MFAIAGAVVSVAAGVYACRQQDKTARAGWPSPKPTDDYDRKVAELRRSAEADTRRTKRLNLMAAASLLVLVGYVVYALAKFAA